MIPYFLLGIGAANLASAATYPVGSVYDETHATWRRLGIALGLLGLLMMMGNRRA